jgi:regulator of nucleoside diphosphate kinase
VLVNDATCASCDAALGAAETACPRCGAAVPPARRSLFQVVTGAPPAAAAPRRDSDDADDVLVTARDFMILEELARLRLRPDEPAARGLIAKLERCRVVPPDTVAADVVTLDSRVVFSVDGGQPEARVLVHPDGHTLSGWSLPVTTPRGLAVLGLRAGATATAECSGGGVERIAILSVAYQPEQAARRRAATGGGSGLPPAPSFLRRSARLRTGGGPPRDDDPPPSAA